MGACSKDSQKATGSASLRASQTAANEFVFNNGAEPETLDPHRMSAHDAAQLAINLYEGLLTLDQSYSKLMPGIAESWTVSEDGKTYSFVIRENLKWSNGEALTMEHIRNSFIRALNPELGNNYIAWYTDYIVGAKALHEGFNSKNRKALEAAYGIQITGPRNLEIKLNRPLAYFKYFLSRATFFIVHPSMYDPSSKAWTTPGEFISNGAYKLTEWKVNQRIVMEKNKFFREADQVKLDKIVSLPIVDDSTTMNLYQTGEIDWTGENTIAANLVPSLRGRDDFYHMPILGTYMYLFNTTKKPFDDVRVRQALAMAIDREQITDRVLRSGVVPSNRIIPPVIEDFQSLVSDETPLEQRVAKAKSLLAEAGYSDLSTFPRFTIRYNTNDGHHRVAQSIQQMWKKYLGIDVSLENSEWKVFLKEQTAGNFEVCRQGWIGDFPDPATFLEIFLSTSENNHSKWKNKEFDQIVNSAITVQDDTERFKQLAKAEKLLAEQAPGFGLYHYAYFSLMRPEVKGFKPNKMGHYLFRYFSK